MNNILFLQLRLKLADLMLQILRLQTKQNPNKGYILYEVAKGCIGKDMAPLENEYGCMEAVNMIFRKAFGVEIGGGLSTYLGYLALENKNRFRRVFTPDLGCIIISPTGFGNNNIPNGHVGIVSSNGKIMSNTSKGGLWKENFTMQSWEERYKIQGGYPIYFYKII